MLKASDRERLQDCLLLVQSARTILTGLPHEIQPGLVDVDNCFDSVDRTLKTLLRT